VADKALGDARYSRGRGSFVRISSIPSQVFEWTAACSVDRPDLGYLVEIVEGLPEPYVTIVNALFWEQCSLTEVALRLQVHRTTLDRLLREALEELQAAVSRRDEVGQVPAASEGTE
jgi:DNA-directed RNA polymerase specialized sigma24 family protein